MAEEVAQEETQKVEDNNEETQEEKVLTAEDVQKIVSEALASKHEESEDEASKLAKMNKQEKEEYNLKQLQDRLDELEREKTHNELMKQARTMLTDKSISVSDDLLEHLVGIDAESTKKSVESFATIFQRELENGIKERLKNPTPKAGAKKSGLTKEQVLAIKDRTERQKAIRDNINLFK